MPQSGGESFSIDPELGADTATRGTDPFTQTDARQLSTLLPFRQVLGIKNVVIAMDGRFPEE